MIKPKTVYSDDMSLFTDSSIYKRVAFVLSILGLAVEFLSFVSPFWISKTYKNGTAINVGLWLTCVNLDCTGISNSPAWLTVAAVFDLLSLLFGVTCIVCLSLFIFKPQFLPKTRRWPLVVIIIFSFVEALLQQIACGVFLKAVHDSPQPSGLLPENAFASLSWAAAFSVIGVILYSVVCILLFTDLVRICFAATK
ncbi:uncharacterized protein LOC134249753 [Saccostrea cucullata]|uniref:uncharacterized protein LOC134249753 n=1 Tax=Saccostrea cuccullata TaxID=36930 RepID=UPI002ED15AA5